MFADIRGDWVLGANPAVVDVPFLNGGFLLRAAREINPIPVKGLFQRPNEILWVPSVGAFFFRSRRGVTRTWSKQIKDSAELGELFRTDGGLQSEIY